MKPEAIGGTPVAPPRLVRAASLRDADHRSRPHLLLDLRSRPEPTASVAGQARGDALLGRRPRAFTEEQARRKIRLYLAVWKMWHPGAAIVLVPPETAIG